MGFLAALDCSITTIALQSVKELEGWLSLFRVIPPSLGFAP
jgi:hypothetical protein